MTLLDRLALVFGVVMALSACGGGGGEPNPAPQPPVLSPLPPPPPSQVALSIAGTARSDAVQVRSDVWRNIQVTALAYDALRGQLVAAAIGDDGGASLQGIDPATLETRWILPAPDVVYRIAVSADGSTLYGAATYAGTVWQVDLARRAGVRQIVVGNAANGEGPLDLAVRPDSPGTVVVAVARWDTPTRNFLHLKVYDDGVARARSTGADGQYGLVTGANEVEFIDANHAVAYDINSTACTLSRLVLMPDGLRHETSVSRPGNCFSDALHVTDGRLITRHGREYDPATLAYVQTWPGLESGTGGGYLNTSRGSFVRVNGGNFAGLFGDTRQRVAVEEYETSRRTLRRSFVTDDPTPVGFAYVLDIADAGGGRLAFTLIDSDTGRVSLHAHDLNRVPMVVPWAIESWTASAEGITGVAIDLPTVDAAFDATLQRLVLALPADLGPIGNSLAIMHPATGAVERIIALPDEPRLIRIAASGSIAYVTTRGALSVLQVDLAAGIVLRQTGVRADGLAIKTDDPSVIAVLKNDTLSDPTITVLRDLVPQGAPVDLWAADPSLALVNWIGTHGNDLVAHDARTNAASLARFAWGTSGLSLQRVDRAVELGLATSGSANIGFGQMWTELGVVDAATLESRGSFPHGLSAAVLTSPSTAAVSQPVGGASFSLAWLRAPTESTAGAWQPQFTVVITDEALFPSPGLISQARMVATGSQRVAMRAQWLGNTMRSMHPGRIYLFDRR